jgi:DNA-binding winged helix-turn-helix (wHTH) protein/TolB-like protein/Tfp pilus assembly protein PilF
MELNTKNFYQFGPFHLEPEEHLLRHTDRPIPLTPKAFDLLVFLVQNQGRLMTKEQIMKAVWPGSYVEDANLTVWISVLRKALGDREGGLRYIETVPKRGYRFTAPVRVAAVPEAGLATEVNSSQPLEKLAPMEPGLASAANTENAGALGAQPAANGVRIPRYRTLGIALALLVSLLAAGGYIAYRMPSARRSLAVLPLENLNDDASSDFLGFSLADAVITKLGVLSSVTVRPSSAVEKYKRHGVDIKRAAAELNVDTLLTGNFIRDGNRLRITYQLVDARVNRMLYTDTIDLEYDRLLTAHDEVSRRIVKGLQLQLTPSEAARIKPDEPISPLAYEYYLRGVDCMGSHSFSLAVKMLEKSTEIDPSYALTWAYLGQAYTSDAAFELGGREQYRRAQAAYERALALQPKQPEAEIFLANLLVDTGKVEKAIPLLRDALSDNSNDAAAHWELGYAYRFAGMLKQSLTECERAREIDPLVSGNGAVLNTYLYLGQYDDFLSSLPGTNESGFFRFYRAFGEYYLGRDSQAAKDFTRAYQEDPTLYTGIGKAFADSIAKNTADGLRTLRGLENKIVERGVGDPEATYKIAQAYAVLGDKSSAIRNLRSSIEGGFFPYPYFVTDPLLNNVRGAGEFPHLMDTARRHTEAFQKQFF